MNPEQADIIIKELQAIRSEAKGFYTIDELADMLKLKTNTIHSWIRSGKVTASHLTDKVVVVMKPDWEKFMKDKRRVA